MIRAGRILALTALFAGAGAQAAEGGERLRFVACPIYRDADAGRKSGCWLVDDEATGQRWDVSLSPYKPDWNFAVLVEGRVSDAPATACGAPVLDPVRTSRLIDQPCTRHMLPAEGFPGRKYKLQGRYINPLSVERPVPPGPYAERVFPVYFEYGSAFLLYQYDDYLLDQADAWLKAAKPRKVIVTGYAVTRPETVSGVTIAEKPEVAKARADMVAQTLQRLIPGIVVETRIDTDPRPTDDADADGLPGQSQRRAEIHALF